MQRFRFGRSGHFSTSELFDAPLGENEPEMVNACLMETLK